MYKIKQKKPWSAFKFIISLLFLAAIGLGIGYAGAKITKHTPDSEYLYSFPISAPEPTSLPETKAASSPVTSEPKETTAPKEEEKFIYLIILEGKKTNVYSLSGNQKTYSHSLPIEPNSLLPEDLTLLKEGIYLKTKDELLSFTEDFCS